MRKYRNILKDIKLCNGGTEIIDGKSYCFSNTCSIDYWLLSIFLVLSVSSIANKRALDQTSNSIELYKVFVKIKDFIQKNNWNSARLEWANFIGLKKKIINGSIHFDCFASISIAFLKK